MFTKVLIANRGEIACRIIATCRRLGVTSVAVYSDADATALHVREADEARGIGAAAARDSYLNIERVLAAARDSGAEAIHPGYGFLSENPQFARRVAEAGLVFIGPPVAALEAMASKATARELMQRSGVPVLPGYQGEGQELAWLRAQAHRIGYPVLIKAASGGGGKGMRTVGTSGDFEASLAACRREAAASFGDERVVLEKYLPAPRHIEVQVFGDAAGNVVHLYERDCSAQRRHQKVIEEAPAPRLPPAQRAALLQAACGAARAVGYSSAGTVEFLFDAEWHFYFIEMNTRIQVEHAVTEMICGVDLVEWQLRVAAGETLPCSQAQIHAAGHAIEARVYAETPESGFLPSSGVLRHFELPAPGPTLRLETGVTSGDTIGIHYDPMLAKLIAWASTREQALATLQGALTRTRIAGVSNNVALLRRLLASAAFQAGQIDTSFIERELPRLLEPSAAGPPPAAVLAAAALWVLAQEQATAVAARRSGDSSPWQLVDGWRLNASLARVLRFESLSGGTPGAERGVGVLEVSVHYGPTGTSLSIGARRMPAQLRALDTDQYQISLDAQALRVNIVEDAGVLTIWLGLERFRLRRDDPLAIDASARDPDSNLAAPMPGRIIAQLVRAGERVAKGAPLLVMEAMKMEHTLCAPADGVVRAYHAEVGTQVQEGAQLIDFESQT